MLEPPATKYLHNDPNAYWCPSCWCFTLDCSHLVEPLTSPSLKLDHWQYIGVTWQKRILQVTMNTGERYQLFGVPRWQAALFVRKPDEEILKGYRFERVRGRIAVSA